MIIAANDNIKPSANTGKFIVGRTYGVRSIGDHNCIFYFKVVARTEKTVSLRNASGKVTRRKVRTHSGGAEACDPHGRFSMSPVLTADGRM